MSDRRYYPIYQTCIDLDIPIVSNAGIAGPRFPSACQDVMHFDEVCYDFPELRIVMRHGAEPWEALAVKLMLKWPNLFYMTSAFAPKYYPKAIIDYANTRGADKIMYAGLLPDGPEPRAHLHRDARRAVPRCNVAEVPARERRACVQAGRGGAGGPVQAAGDVHDPLLEPLLEPWPEPWLEPWPEPDAAIRRTRLRDPLRPA